jgi:hypothetical protein
MAIHKYKMSNSNAINFNWFYHNGFEDIKKLIWEFNNPTKKQLAAWRKKHCKYIGGGYFRVIRDIKMLGRKFAKDGLQWSLNSHTDFLLCDFYDFTEFAFDQMYGTGNGAPWLKG